MLVINPLSEKSLLRPFHFTMHLNSLKRAASSPIVRPPLLHSIKYWMSTINYIVQGPFLKHPGLDGVVAWFRRELLLLSNSRGRNDIMEDKTAGLESVFRNTVSVV